MDTDDEIRNDINDLIDSALDIVMDNILSRREEVVAYNAKGVPVGLCKAQTVSIEEIQAAFKQFKEQNRK